MSCIWRVVRQWSKMGVMVKNNDIFGCYPCISELVLRQALHHFSQNMKSNSKFCVKSFQDERLNYLFCGQFGYAPLFLHHAAQT